jgi:hypothetical protein
MSRYRIVAGQPVLTNPQYLNFSPSDGCPLCYRHYL